MPYSPSNAAWSGVNNVTKKATKVAQEALGWIAPVGKPMKAAKAVKAISAARKAKDSARALKAAQGKSLASPLKKAVAKKNVSERKAVKTLATANKQLGQNSKSAYKNAAKTMDKIKTLKKK